MAGRATWPLPCERPAYLGNTVSPSALVDTNAFDSAVTRQDPDPTPNDNHLQAPQRGQQLHSKRPGQG